MAHCYARDFTLDIFLSCPAVQAERGDETATYHPGETLSGFLKITSRVNIVFEDVFITLEGIVRIWESSPALENELLAVQHRFLRQVQPLPYNNGRRLEITAGDTHMIPFSFKLPQHTTPTKMSVHAKTL